MLSLTLTVTLHLKPILPPPPPTTHTLKLTLILTIIQTFTIKLNFHSSISEVLQRSEERKGFAADGVGPLRAKVNLLHHYMGYHFGLVASDLLYDPYHRRDNAYHGLCYTSRGVLAGKRNSSMASSWRSDPTTSRTMNERSYHDLKFLLHVIQYFCLLLLV